MPTKVSGADEKTLLRGARKDCAHCGQSFTKNPRLSAAQWELTLFCSRRCSAKKATPQSQLERFFSFIEIDPITRCWNWTGGLINEYGAFDGDRAHRFIFDKCVSEVPADIMVLHRCDNTKCCNPYHLFLGNHGINASDMLLKGRGNKACGEANGSARLTEEEVAAIRLDSRHRDEIAKDFQVSVTTISAIQAKKTWKHLP